MLDLADARRTIDREITAILDLLDAASLDDWRRPSPLPGWTVADLAAHLVWGQSLQSDGWEKTLIGGNEPAEGVAVGKAPEQIRYALAEQAEAFQSVLRRAGDADLDRLCPMPYGTLPARLVLHAAVMEAGVHHHDLAVALDLPLTLPDEVTAATLWLLPFALPAMAAAASADPENGTTIQLEARSATVTMRAENGAWTPTPSARPSCRVSGADDAIILFAVGRRQPSDLDVYGDHTLAERFKDLFPGP